MGEIKPTTTAAAPREYVLANGLELLQRLDENGYDFEAIGIATHIVLHALRGYPAVVDEITDGLADSSAAEWLGELVENYYLVEIDGGGVVPAPLDQFDNEDIEL